MSIDRMRKWNLVHTHAGILEGKVAGIIIQTGAEVALVSRFRDGETRLTARAPRSSTNRCTSWRDDEIT